MADARTESMLTLKLAIVAAGEGHRSVILW
jgi:hypothetical protein